MSTGPHLPSSRTSLAPCYCSIASPPLGCLCSWLLAGPRWTRAVRPPLQRRSASGRCRPQDRSPQGPRALVHLSCLLLDLSAAQHAACSRVKHPGDNEPDPAGYHVPGIDGLDAYNLCIRLACNFKSYGYTCQRLHTIQITRVTACHACLRSGPAKMPIRPFVQAPRTCKRPTQQAPRTMPRCAAKVTPVAALREP